MAERQGRPEGPMLAPELAGAGGWINTAEPLSLAALRGKVVLLDFWTFCCINCLHIVEELRPIEAAFPRDLVIVGVHSPKFPEEHDHDAVLRAVARHRITHPVLDDPDMITWQRYGVRSWPTLVLVDTTGAVRGAVSGEGHGETIQRAIAALIEEGRETGTLAAERPIRMAGTAATRGVARDTGVLAFPGKVAPAGANRLLIADTGHDRVLLAGLDGTIQREFGGLREPQGLFLDGGRVVVANCLADEVLAIDLDSGQRTVLASGISSAWDVAPWQGGIAVAEAGRHRLWFIDGAGAARVLAGTSAEGLEDAPALSALLAQPSGLAEASDGALLFLDSETSSLRRLMEGTISTLVGQGLFDWGTQDGTGGEARLQHPLGIAVGADGAVYVADTFNSLLRVWRDNRLSTLPVAGLDEPGGLCMLPDGRLAVADTNHHRILLVDPRGGAAETLPLADTARVGAAHELAAAATVSVQVALDLMGDDLDASDGPPVRIAVSADPPRLLAPGARVWALDTLPAAIDMATGAGGSGTLTFDVRAASCKGDECRLHSRRTSVEIHLLPSGAPVLTV